MQSRLQLEAWKTCTHHSVPWYIITKRNDWALVRSQRSYMWQKTLIWPLGGKATTLYIDSPCQSYITQTAHILCIPPRVEWVGGNWLEPSALEPLSVSPQRKCPPIGIQSLMSLLWSRLMERHGNGRHLARVHPTSSLFLLHHPPSPPSPDAGTHFPQTDWKPLWTNNGWTPV